MIFVVIGNLGSGKSLVTVGRIRDAIRAGRKVATNLDLKMEYLTRGGGRTCVLRIPDVPTLADFEALGRGNDDLDESKNGIIVLDEISSILDARAWAGAGRAALINWLKHTRKLGWDLYFIVQHESMIDSQVRKALFEHLVVCKRLDRVPIPLVGWFLRLTGLSGKFLRMHLATVRYGGGSQSVVSERWWYRGTDLYPAYDTRQIFRPQRSAGLNDDKGKPIIDPATGKPIPDDNPQGIFQYLDLYSAPWMKPRWSFGDRLVRAYENAGFRRVYAWVGSFMPRAESGPWLDFWMAERMGPPAYKPASAMSFAEWSAAQAARAGALGGANIHGEGLAVDPRAGEAPEPAAPQLLHEAA